MGDSAENTLMDDLSAAWDEAESAIEETSDEGLHVDTEEVAAKGADDTLSRPEDTGDTDDARGIQELEEPVSDDDGSPAPVDEPPRSLSPAAREAWKDVPDAVKGEIQKREADYEKGIMKYAQNAKRAEQMDRVMAPYSQFFAMNGGAAQTIPGVLQAASVLQMGSPQQKAQTVAGMIKQFGVDIQTLDSLLVGEQPQQQGPDINQLVDQRLQQYHQQQHQQQLAQQQQGIQTELQQFASDPNNEFYNDIKMDMADIIEMAANRGQQLTLKEAYDRACMMNPQISQILSSRQSQAAVNTKRRAAVSVSGAPGGPGGTEAPTDIRSALEHAWDNAGRD